ncbi:hypothetical protein Moror_11914 [Moniliophthora roreri MCA 2997]|uniref:F-box domain-containing protein n=1 Tax=Moniliophthora roreri (strain MCA 2997) TaxID=1381753 RepID=V2Y606_MONRO|nr:hypothetical protein Moror_11914 [Moniliophthora roreri MCA 2997]
MTTHQSTADRSILDCIDTDEHDDLSQIDQKIQSIEEEMRRLADSLQRLRAQRNARTLISRLPAEILTHIFTYCVPSRWYRTSIHTKWHSFTHVCHSWRSIALDHASLWTCIDFSSMELARTMLERSKTAILDIMVQGHHVGRDEKRRELLKVIKLQFFRIGHMEVCSYTFRGLFDGLVQPSPSLRSLALINYDRDDPVNLPDQFLGGNAPLLSHITLHSVYLPWHSPLPILQSLTSLVLTGNHFTNLPTGRPLFDTLRNVPRLEFLNLAGIFPISIMETDIIPLPKLRQLDLGLRSEDFDRCTGFVEHLEFPESTALNINYIITSEDASVFDPLLSYLSRTFSKNENESATVESPRTIKALALVFTDFGFGVCIELNAWNIGTIPFECKPSLRPPSILGLELTWRHSRANPPSSNPDVLKAVLRPFSMHSIETFHIDYQCNFGRDSGSDGGGNLEDDPVNNLEKYLGPLPWSTSIRTLGIYGSSSFPKQLLSALLSIGCGLAESGLTVESSTPFPATQTLVLLDSRLGYSGVGFESFARMLADALVLRMKSGHDLEKLIIKTSCQMTEETFAILKEVVEEFELEQTEP